MCSCVYTGPLCVGNTSVYINGTLSTSSKAELAPTVPGSAYIKVSALLLLLLMRGGRLCYLPLFTYASAWHPL